jgi:hypothetical protein
MNKNKWIISLIAVAAITGGISFYGGMKYGDSRKASIRMGQQGIGGRPQGTGANASGNVASSGQRPESRGNSGGFIDGQITSKDDKSFTVKSADGSSKIVFYSDQTSVGKSEKTGASDLAVGQNVMVNGKSSPDGSVSALDVQIKP